MTVLNVLMMTISELIGNTHLKWFADHGRQRNLVFGMLAYLGVIYFLVKSLGSKSMMWTCIMWEAMIVIGGAITAYVIFGEKFNHWIQWLGILFALAAAVCVNYECDTKDVGHFM